VKTLIAAMGVAILCSVPVFNAIDGGGASFSQNERGVLIYLTTAAIEVFGAFLISLVFLVWASWRFHVSRKIPGESGGPDLHY